MDMKLALMLIETASSIIRKYSAAKSSESDGGEKITANELVEMAAIISKAWADKQQENAEIGENEISDIFTIAGWRVINDEPIGKD